MALWADGPAETREPGVLFAAASGKGASWESKWENRVEDVGVDPQRQAKSSGPYAQGHGALYS